jgi:hypothetical protein
VATAVLLLDHVPPVDILSIKYSPLPIHRLPDDGENGKTVAKLAIENAIARMVRVKCFIRFFCVFG